MRTSKNQLIILKILTLDNWNTNNQWYSTAIAEETGIRISSVNRTLDKMVKENQVIKTLHQVKEFKQPPRKYYTYRLIDHDYSEMDIDFIFGRLHLESRPTFLGDMQTSKSQAQAAIDSIAALNANHYYIKVLQDYLPTAPDKGFWD